MLYSDQYCMFQSKHNFTNYNHNKWTLHISTKLCHLQACRQHCCCTAIILYDTSLAWIAMHTRHHTDERKHIKIFCTYKDHTHRPYFFNRKQFQAISPHTWHQTITKLYRRIPCPQWDQICGAQACQQKTLSISHPSTIFSTPTANDSSSSAAQFLKSQQDTTHRCEQLL